MFLNAFDTSKSTVRLFQYSEKGMNEIVDYFCDHSLNHRYHHTIVGSTAEGLEDCKSDIDVIMFNSKHVVIESINDTYDCTDPEILVVRIPDEGHPGYSKLRVHCIFSIKHFQFGIAPSKYAATKDGKVYLKNSVKELIPAVVKFHTHYSINGPAFHTKSNEHHVKKVLQELGIETQIFDSEYDSLEDVVFCIKSTEWPIEASEWTRRRRASNWPTKELFDNIINAGYYLAAVGSKESKYNEIQWRVSFNKAELLIIESFNETQIHCIRLLKILKNNRLSKIAGNNITSYTMKTVMFWCLEEKSDEFWQSSNLMVCFCFCVSKLKSFVENVFIPNYFLRDRNQFIASEFTCEIQKKTNQYLDRFLRNPKHGISLLLPSYKYSAKTSISELHLIGMNRFILNWLQRRLLTTQENYIVNRDLLWKLYDGYNIQNILLRCDMALEKLKTISYTQPLIKNLQNYMGLLQYILLREEKKTS
ncbi:unnamed protein product [Mytilus coruscus]|uniref:Uncharacterized protein n=1 Tax=Mytilus coruscus TaxID=42192 RepID=A0A6J8ENQ1_MYTCO|nr:unnamed protein product [Mytilus coruscus]